jgi:hypothetical protein
MNEEPRYDRRYILLVSPEVSLRVKRILVIVVRVRQREIGWCRRVGIGALLGSGDSRDCVKAIHINLRTHILLKLFTNNLQH